jgi:hypothetical protein
MQCHAEFLGRNNVLNWKIRYNKILEQNPSLYDPTKSVLEVGCGPMGIAQYLTRPVTGLEPQKIQSGNEWLNVVQGDILNIPYPDDAFDFVLCVDVLEHLDGDARPRSVKELWRVAREKVLISCPCHKWALRGERELSDFFHRMGLQVPTWLVEHLEHDFPNVGDIVGYITDLDVPFEFCGNETLLQHYSGIFLDFFLPYAKIIHENQMWKAPLDLAIRGTDWELFYSFLFTIKKQQFLKDDILLDSDVRVYAIFHTPTNFSNLIGPVKPIFAGEAAAAAAREGELTDILEHEPRLLNSRWSELSAVYKIWREGPRSAVVGFCHYRRLFAFDTGQNDSVRERPIAARTIPEHAGSFVSFDEAEKCKYGAIVLPRLLRLAEPVFDQYCSGHSTNDWCWVMSKLSVTYPELVPHITHQFSSYEMYANNMFITKWEWFDEICRIWFDVLKRFEATVSPYRAGPYQNRDISFLAERIFDAWVRYKQSMGAAIIETPIYLVR